MNSLSFSVQRPNMVATTRAEQWCIVDGECDRSRDLSRATAVYCQYLHRVQVDLFCLWSLVT